MGTSVLARAMWSGLTLGLLGVLGSTVLPHGLSGMALGYGVLIILSAVYLGIGLAIRARVWRRLGVSRPPRAPVPGKLQGRRVF